jgi:hypothetical protein
VAVACGAFASGARPGAPDAKLRTEHTFAFLSSQPFSFDAPSFFHDSPSNTPLLMRWIGGTVLVSNIRQPDTTDIADFSAGQNHQKTRRT